MTEQAAADDTVGQEERDSAVADLIPMLRRIVAARVGSHPAAEDLVQETLVRVLAAQEGRRPCGADASFIHASSRARAQSSASTTHGVSSARSLMRGPPREEPTRAVR